ncbi:MAG: ABC transporter substrate-binding protein, partial [Actinobacteria bacterium]
MRTTRTLRTTRIVRIAVAAALAAGLLAAAGAAAGCKPKTATPQQSVVAPEPAPEVTYPVTITDDASRTVTVPAKPERVVSLAPANTEIVCALGAIDRLVGVTTFCDYPPEVAEIAKVGDFAQPNVEAIAAADPDVVFATSGVQADVVSKLEEAGAVVVVVDPQSLEGLYRSVVDVAVVLGDAGAGEELIAGMQSDLAALRAKLGAAEPVPCFIEIAQDPLFTVGTGTLMDELITAAGGRNVVTQPGYVGYSVEQLLKDDPAVYLATKGSMSDPADVAKRAGYSQLAAVKAGRVVTLDDNLVSRPG